MSASSRTPPLMQGRPVSVRLAAERRALIEAAAAVGELPAKWREFADGLDRKHDLTFAQICMRDAVRDCADTLEAALSPTTSAAREGSDV